MQPQKRQNDLSFSPRQTIQHHSNPSLCPSTHAKEAEVEWCYEDLEDLLWPWSTNEAGERLTEFFQENSLVMQTPFLKKHKRQLYTSVQFSSVAQLCLTLCDPMNFSTPGLHVHHQLPDSLKHMSIESVIPSSNLILCHPFSSCPNPSQHQNLFQ